MCPQTHTTNVLVETQSINDIKFPSFFFFLIGNDIKPPSWNILASSLTDSEESFFLSSSKL